MKAKTKEFILHFSKEELELIKKAAANIEETPKAYAKSILLIASELRTQAAA
jgi:hypothetical protein